MDLLQTAVDVGSDLNGDTGARGSPAQSPRGLGRDCPAPSELASPGASSPYTGGHRQRTQTSKQCSVPNSHIAKRGIFAALNANIFFFILAAGIGKAVILYAVYIYVICCIAKRKTPLTGEVKIINTSKDMPTDNDTKLQSSWQDATYVSSAMSHRTVNTCRHCTVGGTSDLASQDLSTPITSLQLYL